MGNIDSDGAAALSLEEKWSSSWGAGLDRGLGKALLCDIDSEVSLKRFLWLGGCVLAAFLLYKKRSKIAEPRGTGILLQFLAQAFK